MGLSPGRAALSAGGGRGTKKVGWKATRLSSRLSS